MVEKNRILGYHTDSSTKRSLSNITNIFAIDQDATFALFEVIESVKKTEDSGLSRSRLADQSDRRVFRNTERDSLKGSVTTIVGEIDVI